MTSAGPRSRATILVVVVAIHADERLERCLAALERDPSVAAVVLVDNGGPNSLEVAGSGDLTVLRPGYNVGFGRGCNLGTAQLRTEEYVAFVNPDVILTESLGSVVAGANPDAAILSARLMSVSGRPEQNLRPMASPSRELLRGLIGTRAYRSSDRMVAGGRWADQVAGSLLVVPAARWLQLDGFDERFELYYEDVDLCRRAQALGGIWVVDRIVGCHEGGTSYRRNTREAFAAVGVSRLRYLRKWYGRRGTIIALLVSVLEFVSRGVAGCEEGWATRSYALRAQWKDAARPGSVWILRGAPAGPEARG